MEQVQGPAKSSKWEKKHTRPQEALKLAIGPDMVLIFGQCSREKLNWPAH